MKLLPHVTAILAGITIVACATNYQENQEFGGIYMGGYSNTRINANTSVVSFDASKETNIQLVRIYLLYRCAQVTISNGYNYFIVTSMSTSVYNTKIIEGYKQFVTNPPRLYSTSHYVKAKYAYSYLTPTANPDIYRNQEVMEANNHKAVAVIQMFQGIKPNIPNAYNAEDVIAHYGPSIL